MKVSDAVVEVAANQMAQMGCEGSPGYLMRVARAALEAALPMVVGEAVAWEILKKGRTVSLLSRPPMDGEVAFEEGESFRHLYTLTNLEDAP